MRRQLFVDRSIKRLFDECFWFPPPSLSNDDEANENESWLVFISGTESESERDTWESWRNNIEIFRDLMQ